METSTGIGESILERLGVKPIIQAGGPNTMHSGSRPRPETLEAMEFASRHFFQMDELLVAAGGLLADMIGVPAATVTSGAGAGLVVQAASAVAKDDPDKILRLPDTAGLANELIIQRGHSFGYERLYLVPGTRFVWVGEEKRCTAEQLEAAITSATAGIIHLESGNLSPHLVPLPETARIAHARGLPVLCDAASVLPPRANLTRFVREGADLVSFSGGKTIRGIQSSGLLLGNKQWVEYARLNNAPHTGVARGQKVSKEEIFGLIAALDAFLAEDEAAETAAYRKQMQLVVDQIAEVPGILARVEHNPPNHRIPHAVVYFQPGWKGPRRSEVQRRLLEGEPRVYVQTIGIKDELYVDPMNIQQGELETVARRVREVLLQASAGR